MQANLFATNHRVFDAIIIGGGPAGINCALELSYCGVDCLLINSSELIGGQLFEIGEELVNFAGGYFKDGASLAKTMQKLAEKARINVLVGVATKIDAEKKTVSVNGDVYQGRTLLLCTGYRLKKLDLPGVSLFRDEIFYRDETAVTEYAGCRVAVLGGGDNALLKALSLATAVEQVFLLNRTNHWRARRSYLEKAQSEPRIEIIQNTDLVSLSGASHLNEIRLADKSTGRFRNVAVDKIFVKIGYAPNTEAFVGQVEMDKSGHIIIDESGQTSVKGVFCAGDIVANSVPRIATACGTGSTAAQSMQIFLGSRLSPE